MLYLQSWFRSGLQANDSRPGSGLALFWAGGGGAGEANPHGRMIRQQKKELKLNSRKDALFPANLGIWWYMICCFWNLFGEILDHLLLQFSYVYVHGGIHGMVIVVFI